MSTSSRKENDTSDLLAKRLRKYGAAAAAIAVSQGGLAEKSEAEIISFTTPVTQVGNGRIFFDGVSATSLATTSSSPTNTQFDIALNGGSLSFGFFFVGDETGSDGGSGSVIGTFLSNTDVIDATGFGSNFSVSGLLPVANQFIGFRLNNQPGLPSTLFGWAEISADSGTAETTLHQWAYENTGAAITAGATVSAAVPEPSTTAACATLAMAGGITALRRRRKQRKESTQSI